MTSPAESVCTTSTSSQQKPSLTFTSTHCAYNCVTLIAWRPILSSFFNIGVPREWEFATLSRAGYMAGATKKEKLTMQFLFSAPQRAIPCITHVQFVWLRACLHYSHACAYICMKIYERERERGPPKSMFWKRPNAQILVLKTPKSPKFGSVITPLGGAESWLYTRLPVVPAEFSSSAAAICDEEGTLGAQSLMLQGELISFHQT